jgi:hypothetical protein
MQFDPDYLNRSLQRRGDARKESFSRAIESMLAQMAARGMLGSGVTLRQMGEIAITQLTEAFNDAATLAYSLAEQHGPEVAAPLQEFADRITADMISYLQERGKNTGLGIDLVNKQLQSVVEALQSKKAQLVDDFEHGILGSEKLKKDPLVNLVAHQNNSPGAVQQIGVGDFSQSAMVQNYGPLIEAIDDAIKSPEYQALSPAHKIAFIDIADALKEEAAKPKSDPGKLRRWGARLIEFAAGVGMTVAASAIAQVLGKIFIG